MDRKYSEKVFVSTDFDSKPYQILWRNQLYSIKEIAFQHSYRNGECLYHVFSVITDNMFFKLELDTNSLIWKVKEIQDGVKN